MASRVFSFCGHFDAFAVRLEGTQQLVVRNSLGSTAVIQRLMGHATNWPSERLQEPWEVRCAGRRGQLEAKKSAPAEKERPLQATLSGDGQFLHFFGSLKLSFGFFQIEPGLDWGLRRATSMR